jgi:hypothetical protein
LWYAGLTINAQWLTAIEHFAVGIGTQKYFANQFAERRNT